MDPFQSKQTNKAARQENVVKLFGEIWTELFTSPVHLDSALSKRSRNTKSILAQIVPQILLQPSSLAEALGVGIAEGEPWSLDQQKLVSWRPAYLMAEHLYGAMSQGRPDVDAVIEDFPAHMIQEWTDCWDKATARTLSRTLGSEAPLSLRASTRMGAEKLLKELTAMSLPVKVQRSDLSPLGVRLSGYAPVLGTDLYQNGNFEIQDEGSQVMALFALWPELFEGLLQEKPGNVRPLPTLPELPKNPPAWTVVDACAGAGGKSLAFADALKGKGRVYSYDTSERKLQALRRRATRAQVNNIQAVAVEEGQENLVIDRFKKTAHVVLVDAPCSGWGVLRRNPDIKWRQSPDVLMRMPLIQYRLLSQYSELVQAGGRLVFGVCTFREAETTAIVEKFLDAHPDFEKAKGGFVGPGPTDGFFMQAFLRKK
ncbi:MAG: hypothetical protein H7222_10890 [Methylotenera sp.]|nr:hypothetical protein [Oligoflexia bacterium]